MKGNGKAEVMDEKTLALLNEHLQMQRYNADPYAHLKRVNYWDGKEEWEKQWEREEDKPKYDKALVKVSMAQQPWQRIVKPVKRNNEGKRIVEVNVFDVLIIFFATVFFLWLSGLGYYVMDFLYWVG